MLEKVLVSLSFFTIVPLLGPSTTLIDQKLIKESLLQNNWDHFCRDLESFLGHIYLVIKKHKILIPNY